MAVTKRKEPREYMKKAIEVMQKSIQENRADKSSPYVGSCNFNKSNDFMKQL